MLVIPRDEATVYMFTLSEGSLCGKGRESSVLDVNSGYILHTNSQYNSLAMAQMVVLQNCVHDMSCFEWLGLLFQLVHFSVTTPKYM